MSIEQLRKILETINISGRWKRKVKNMNDGQVLAVYHCFLDTNRIPHSTWRCYS